jgi:hypothetical protein
MRKFSHVNLSPDCALDNSLSAIKQANFQLDFLLSRMETSPILLVSRIQLCDVLLVEIAGIRSSSLARDLKHTHLSHLEIR